MMSNIDSVEPKRQHNAHNAEALLEEHERIKNAGKLHWFHWFIISLSLLLTFSVWYFARTQLNTKIENKFNRESEQVIGLVSDRMKKYEDALWSGVATIHSQNHGVNYEQWKRFSKTLKIEQKYPGINGIGVIYHILPEDIPSYLKEKRAVRPDFKIHPAHEQNELFPITYIEPVVTNAAAVGLDMAHETNRYTAAKKARDTGESQITGPIILVQDAQKTPGFLFYAPFYDGGSYETLEERRKHFIGMVYAPFIFKKLIRGTLAKENRHVSISIRDGKEVLYDEHTTENKDFDSNPLFKKTLVVPAYGRNWTFEIWSTLSFRQETSNNKPWMVLVGGVVIDSLLLGLFIFLARANRRAVQFANDMTQDYQYKTKLLSNIIDNTVDGLITIDGKGTIETFNKACEKIFGYKADEVIGENVKMLMPEPYHSEHDGYLKNYRDTGKKKIIGLGREFEGQRKNGTVFPLDVSVSEINIQDRKLYSGIIRDITERKMAEDEIIRSNEELERFAYVASHDLQEPLRMVTNFTGLLEKRYGDQLDEQAKEYIGFAFSSAKRMQDLVNDLLEYARIGQEAENFKEVDIKQVIELVEENLKDSIDSSNAAITHEDLPIVHVNPMRLMRVIQNLVGNGIKYQAEGVNPEIHISAEEKNNAWLISIKDNGIGMKPEYCEKIFEPFKRLHAKNEYVGTGMGLAICRKIIEGFDGTIWAESEQGKGSAFYFTIPVHARRQQNEKERAA